MAGFKLLGERKVIWNNSPLKYGKGFLQPPPAFSIRYRLWDGSRRLRSGEETTFIGSVLEIFKWQPLSGIFTTIWVQIIIYASIIYKLLRLTWPLIIMFSNCIVRLGETFDSFYRPWCCWNIQNKAGHQSIRRTVCPAHFRKERTVDIQPTPGQRVLSCRAVRRQRGCH